MEYSVIYNANPEEKEKLEKLLEEFGLGEDIQIFSTDGEKPELTAEARYGNNGMICILRIDKDYKVEIGNKFKEFTEDFHELKERHNEYKKLIHDTEANIEIGSDKNLRIRVMGP